MLDALLRRVRSLHANRTPFALAIVVRHEQPISGKTGDKAIILEDGSLSGWIGGGCTKPLIVAEAQMALRDGKHRFVRITPSDRAGANGIIHYGMSCHGGGSLDIYIEPMIPAPQLVIFGQTELVRTLYRLASVVGYETVVVAPEATPGQFPDANHFQRSFDLGDVALGPRSFAVVATQGERDNDALREAIARKIPYVAFVASRQKAQKTIEHLAHTGVDAHDLARVRAPAGIDIGARSPAEIAVSILAEIVSELHTEVPLSDQAGEAMHTESLSVYGMSCSHCVAVVREAIESVKGVSVDDVKVGSATVSIDPAIAVIDDVVQAIGQRGYSAAARRSAHA